MHFSRVIRTTTLLAGLAALQTVCFAAPPTDQEIARCRDQADATSRLGCYDQLFGVSAAAAAAAAAAPTGTSTIPGSAAIVRFGFNGPEGGQSAPKSLAFVVARVDRRPAGEFIVTFEDGQVWQQSELNTKIDIQRGDQVVIRRAALGSFLLVSRAGLSTRVKRVR